MNWGDVDDVIRHGRQGNLDGREVSDALAQIKRNMQELEAILHTKADEE